MKISIVTPSLNRADMIAGALASVSDQEVGDIEHIVIDGGSSDGTPEIVGRDFPHVRLVVEPDRNLYCAINKGIRLASGDVIGFLNTDDRLLPGSLLAVRECFSRRPDVASVCGGCEMRMLDGTTSGALAAVYNDSAMKRLRAGDIISGLTLTNGRFFRRAALDALGGFCENLPVLADREFLARYLLAGYATATVDEPIYAYGMHAGSLTFSGRIDARQLNELTTFTRDRVMCAADRRTRAFYRRWHGWAAGYEIARAAARGRISEVCGLGVLATKTNARWPVYFVRQAVWHMLTRYERHQVR